MPVIHAFASCLYATFCLQLYRETDFIYDGIISRTAKVRSKLVLTCLTREEYKNFGKTSKQLIAKRINTFLNIIDFIYIIMRILF